MKTYIPILYGVAVSSAVAYYVTQERPNSDELKSKDAGEELVKKVQPAHQDSAQHTMTIGLLNQSINEAIATTAEGIKVSPNRLINKKNDTIPADKNVVYGVMDNGMKYIILKNEKPEKRVSMRLHVGAGSLCEADDQRGVAHFLEHMVFNGTQNFPDAKKLIPKMQRLGIAFGAHANAYTSFDETVYMLDLPNKEADTLDLAFKVMHDFAGGALLENSEIDEERGVISSEKTSRDSVGMRIMEQQFAELLPDSLIAKRFPIGTEKVIQTAKRERFTDFYTRFYRPKNMCFVYVGDIEPKQAEAIIKKTFGDLKEPANPGAKPSIGKVTTGRGFKTAIFTDKEVTSTDISLTSVRKYASKPDTASNRSANMPLSIANSILSKRFSNLRLDDPDCPILSGSASRQVIFKELELGGIDVTAKDNDWRKALPVLVAEYKRAREHGFTAKEIKEAKASIINRYENRVKSAASRKSKDLASALVQNHHNSTVYSTPETDLAIVKEALSNITTDTCHQSFRAFWTTPDIHLTLTTQNKEDGAKKLLSSMFLREIIKKTEAPKKEVTTEFAYTDFGKPGDITKTNQVADLGITQLTFANGVRVNLKKTDFQANSISMVANFGGGALSQPKDKPGIGEFSSTVMSLGALGKHSVKDLQSLLAGKSVGWSFGIDSDSFSYSGGTNKEDLTLQLQLLAAGLTDPGFRPEAARLFQSQLPTIYKRLNHSPAGGQNKMQGVLTANDSRFIFPEKEAFDKLTIDDAKKWIRPALEDSYLELSIIGDFDIGTMKAALKQTVGALPKRKDSPVDFSVNATLGKVDFPVKKILTFDSKIPTAMAIDAWRCERTKDNVSEARRLTILAEIISDRMRVKLREELGQAYSPGAAAQPDDTFLNKSYILAYCPGKPADVEKLSSAIVEIGDKLAREGASEDELKRALTPKLAGLKKSKKSNAYWLGAVMLQSQLKPQKYDWARGRDKDYANIKLAEINALAAKYLKKDNVAQFIIKPKGQ